MTAQLASRKLYSDPTPRHRHRDPAALVALLALLWGAASTLALDPEKAITQYVSDHWTVADGLPPGSVRHLLQTPDGYLWIGTEEGLVRFDGARFETLDRSNTPAIASNAFFGGLSVAPDGALWAGSNAGVVRLRGSEVRLFTTADGLSHDRVHSVLAEQSQVWIGTRYLNRLADGQVRVYTEQDGLPGPDVAALARDRTGTLWIGTLHGLCRLRDGAIEPLTSVPGLPADEIWTLHQARDGVLWIGMQSGLSPRGGLPPARHRPATPPPAARR